MTTRIYINSAELFNDGPGDSLEIFVGEDYTIKTTDGCIFNNVELREIHGNRIEVDWQDNWFD